MSKVSCITLFLKCTILVKHTAGTTLIRAVHMTACEQYLAYKGTFSGNKLYNNICLTLLILM
jgi:hypothetical protein